MGKGNKGKGKRKGEGKVRKPQLPEDVIPNVLKRLPAKSLMQFKCVCKAWHALIRDPCFAESHYVCSKSRPDASYLLFYLTDNFRRLPRAVFPTSPNAVFSTQLPTKTFDNYLEPCTNVLNGLICLWDRYWYRVNLLNVTTQEMVALPLHQSLDFGYRRSYFLGFDPVPKVYKVLYTTYGLEEAFVLTLGEKSWRKIKDCPHFPANDITVSVDGIIYWMDKLFTLDNARLIQFFDLQEERFSFLSTPGDAEKIDFITEIKGNFTLGSFNEYKFFDLWIMDKDNHQVWVKDKIEIPQVLTFLRQYEVIGTTNTGEILITSRFYINGCWTELIFYNLSTREYSIGEVTVLPGQPPAIGNLLALASKVLVSHHVENIIPLEFASDEQED